MSPHEQVLVDRLVEQAYEYDLLQLANEHGKFAIAVNYPLSRHQQQALERLQVRQWVQLIDVACTESSSGQLMRIFLVSSSAKLWKTTYEQAKSFGGGA